MTEVREINNPPTRTISNPGSTGSGSPSFTHVPPISMPPLPPSIGNLPGSGSPELISQPQPHTKHNLPSSISHSNLHTRPVAAKRAISQSVSTSNLNGNLSPPNSIGEPTLGGRRSSFGLNFLSTFTHSIRSNQGNEYVGTRPGNEHAGRSVSTPGNEHAGIRSAATTGNEHAGTRSVSTHSLSAGASGAISGPTSAVTTPFHEPPNTFMSNSPTIANLNNYAGPVIPEIARLQTQLETSASPNSSPTSEFEVPPRLGLVNHHSTTDLNNLTHISNEEVAVLETSTNGMDKDGFFSVRVTPLIDHSSSTSGLYFSPVIRKIKPVSSITIGRYTEKNKSAAHAPQGSSAPVVFKSKVVSRTHALFQCNEDGQWFLKDCKSSSGTFLNHVRLSPASEESSMMPLVDGDIIQLGMDYRGGTEEVYRCVKMRCEFNRSWQRKVNQFNLEIHQKLKNLQLGSSPLPPTPVEASKLTNPLAPASLDELAECAICLMKIEPCQALFISPCSHAWHYKCIRPIIIKSYPQFYCPNCRTMCDLETDLDEDD